MEEAVFQAAENLLVKSENVLIAVPEQATLDALAAGLALQAFIEERGGDAVIAFPGVFPDRLKFLPGSDLVSPLRFDTSELVVSLSTNNAQLGELRYDTLPSSVEIHLKAKEGQFTEHDITVRRGTSVFDLLVTVGAETPEQLGDTFTNNANLFYSVPRINIDISPLNENHGSVNLVDVTRSSISELLYRLFVRISEDAIPSTATALLVGILANTDSMKNNRTTPETFAAVADIAAAGANYTDVVAHVFKTEQLSFLKLWGRSLARLKIISSANIGYSVLLQADFDKTGESVTRAKDVLAELCAAVGSVSTVLLVVPASEGARVLGVTGGHVSAEVLSSKLSASSYKTFKLDQGTGAFECLLSCPIDKAEALLEQVFGLAER